MREALAAFIVIWLLFATFWPAEVGHSLGTTAGKIAKHFDAAYRTNRVAD